VRSLQFGRYYYFGPEVWDEWDKWDECECCISFAVWRVVFCHLIIIRINVNIEYLCSLEGIILLPNYKGMNRV
jgi:hypothetical protein